MLVTRKSPPESDTVFCVAAVPRLVTLISAPGTALPAGSTMIPRIELETVWADPIATASANRAINSASLRGCIQCIPSHWGGTISETPFECKRLQREFTGVFHGRAEERQTLG